MLRRVQVVSRFAVFGAMLALSLLPSLSCTMLRLKLALATEYGPAGIRVNAILPGAVDTDMYRSKNDTPEAQAFITQMHALKRVSTPEELARSVLYLTSDDSAFVTGTASLVDGGISITRT